MKRNNLVYLLGLVCVFILSGCVVRTYPLTRDRVDQDLAAGNRGYLKGQSPSGEVKERKSTRTTQAIEIELHSPIKFEKAPKVKIQESAAISKTEIEGNRGYITQSITPEIAEVSQAAGQSLEKYTVQKNDTLQKISKKFYGTTKKWTKIYDANKDIMKGPNKIYPGQVINIPSSPELKSSGESLKEPKENLK